MLLTSESLGDSFCLRASAVCPPVTLSGFELGLIGSMLCSGCRRTTRETLLSFCRPCLVNLSMQESQTASRPSNSIIIEFTAQEQTHTQVSSRSRLFSGPFISRLVTATHIRYYEIIKKPVERLGYSHTWAEQRWQPKPGFSNLPNMERWPRPITWPDLLSSHRYRRVHLEFNMASGGGGRTACDGTM